MAIMVYSVHAEKDKKQRLVSEKLQPYTENEIKIIHNSYLNPVLSERKESEDYCPKSQTLLASYYSITGMAEESLSSPSMSHFLERHAMVTKYELLRGANAEIGNEILTKLNKYINVATVSIEEISNLWRGIEYYNETVVKVDDNDEETEVNNFEIVQHNYGFQSKDQSQPDELIMPEPLFEDEVAISKVEDDYLDEIAMSVDDDEITEETVLESVDYMKLF